MFAEMLDMLAVKGLSCCVPPGIFHRILLSRKGAHSCPVASGVIFAVNVDVRGASGAPVDAYSQDLLVSLQARQPSSYPASS